MGGGRWVGGGEGVSYLALPPSGNQTAREGLSGSGRRGGRPSINPGGAAGAVCPRPVLWGTSGEVSGGVTHHLEGALAPERTRCAALQPRSCQSLSCWILIDKAGRIATRYRAAQAQFLRFWQRGDTWLATGRKQNLCEGMKPPQRKGRVTRSDLRDPDIFGELPRRDNKMSSRHLVFLARAYPWPSPDNGVPLMTRVEITEGRLWLRYRQPEVTASPGCHWTPCFCILSPSL